MTKQLLHYPYVGPGIEHVGGKGVAQGVGRDDVRQPGGTSVSLDDLPASLPAEPPTPRVEEQGPTRRGAPRATGQYLPRLGELAGNRFSSRRADRDATRLAPFAGPHQKGTLVEVHVVDVERHQLGDANAATVESLQDGAVAPP